MAFGDSEFIAILANRSVNMAAFSQFPYTSTDTSTRMQGIVLI